MAKVVRLKGHEQREWNANLSILVNTETGVIVRPITAKESMTMFQVSRQVARTRQALTTETPEEGSKVEARIEELHGGGVMVRFYIDDMIVVGGREAMKSRILAEHGECILYRTNNKFLCAVRDPNLTRPNAVEANRSTPHPDHCACAKWAGRQQGRHHPVCQHNQHAPPEERGEFVAGQTASQTVLAPGPRVTAPKPPPSMLAAGTVLPGFGKKGGAKPARPVGTPIATGRTAPAVQVGVQAPHPTACACAKWALPDGTVIDRQREHHPICEWKDKWVVPPAEVQAETPAETPTKPDASETPLTDAAPKKMYLVNVNDGVVLREADAAEIAAGEANDGIVIIDNVPYGLIDEQGVEDAEEETAEEPVPEES